MSFLEVQDIILRAIEPSDLSFLMQVENDSSEWMHSENYMPFSKAVMKLYVNGEHDIVKHGQYRFIIQLNDQNLPVGCIDLFNYSPINNRAGVGIYISKEFRNKGLALSALNLLEEYSKNILGIELLYCSILESNEHSLKLFKSAGFDITGKRLKWFKKGRVREDIVLLQRLITET